MGHYRTFTHYRVAAAVPGVVRQWIADLRSDAPPYGEWLADLQLIFQDIRAPGVDLDRAVESLHDLAAGTGPVVGHLAGAEIVPRGEDFALALTVDLEPDVPALGRILSAAGTSPDAAIVPWTARPYIVLLEDLATIDEAEAMRRAIASAPGPDSFPIDRVQILGTSGRAGWWQEIGSARLGGRRPDRAPDRPLLRHARGWRLAG